MVIDVEAAVVYPRFMPPFEAPAQLPPRVVRVWEIDLEDGSISSSDLEALLGPEERVRAERFHQMHDRERFVRSHGILRRLLGQASRLDPGTIRYEYGPRGKPRLLEWQPRPSMPGSVLQFNLSHSGSRALVALAWDREVGVDIEEIRPRVAMDELVQRFFAARECAEFAGLAPELRIAAFYAGWTRKEALVKATGQGIAAAGLSDFAVRIDPEAEPGPYWAKDPALLESWSVREVATRPGYRAAVAASGTDWRVDAQTWNP